MPAADTDADFHALALTGGGFRGLFTARVLELIEAAAGEPLGRRFDLCCGTSIGGMVALAVAFERPMAQVVRVFEAEGTHIFPPQRRTAAGPGHRVRELLRPRYDSQALRAAMAQLIDPQARLGDALHPLLIPALNVSTGRPRVFRSGHGGAGDQRLRALDVALATAAAPTFFELVTIEGQRYADGGLYAHAPDLLVLHEAEHGLGIPAARLRLLSVGTATRSHALARPASRRPGLSGWLREQRLFSLLAASQQRFVEHLVQQRLGERYLRLDHDQADARTAELGVDVVTESARQTLRALANQVAAEALTGRLTPFLRHRPPRALGP